jgi:nicotinamide-nucleotide amidase
MPAAEIITIGSELLLGETLDTNSQYLARFLRGLGIVVSRSQTIGDDTEQIASALSEALQRTDIVITTGGLGPTVDDPTRQAVAHALGVENEFRPALWEQVTARVARYGRTPSENQRRQAYLPHGAIAIENPVGTAPAFIIEQDDKAIICLPGVPGEMETLLTIAVAPYLQQHYKLHEVIRLRTLHTAGMGESSVDELVGDLEKSENPAVGLAAHSGVIDIRIAVKAATTKEADAILANTEREIRSRLGISIFGADDDTLPETTGAILAKHGWTMAGFENNFSGHWLKYLSRIGMESYRGGEELKLPRKGDISSKSDLEKGARDVRLSQSATFALALSLERAEEQALIAIVLDAPKGQVTHALTYGGHPQYAVRWACNMALDWLRRMILEKKLDELI